MNRNVLLGIGTGVAICAVGIACTPKPPLCPEATAVFAGALGGLALLMAAFRHRPAATGCRGAGIIILGGFAITTGILSGPAALGTAVLMAGAGILLGRTLLRGGAPGQRLPVGDST